MAMDFPYGLDFQFFSLCEPGGGGGGEARKAHLQ
jgi:hypothetical protein